MWLYLFMCAQEQDTKLEMCINLCAKLVLVKKCMQQMIIAAWQASCQFTSIKYTNIYTLEIRTSLTMLLTLRDTCTELPCLVRVIKALQEDLTK